MKDYFMVDCPYANKCSSVGFKCATCKHNKKKNKDHYEPDKSPYIWPNIPYKRHDTPGLPPKPWDVWCLTRL